MKLQYAIGGAIKELRHERNLTLRKLSTKAFVSIGHLSDIEHGAKAASSNTLEAIAVGLDLTTAQLLKEIYEYLEEWENN